MTIIPESQLFDQRTMHVLIEHDATVQRYRALFALLDWRVVPEPSPDPSRPGKRPHPPSAYIKALLIKLTEGYQHCTQLRRFLVEHPLLVLELGFRPVLNIELPYGFDVERTVGSRPLVHPTATHARSPCAQRAVRPNRAGAARGDPRPGRDRGLRREAHLLLGA